jgi:hypothetical protein
VESTVGPASLAGGLFSAGFGTLVDVPREYGSHWEGFGKRYGMRFTGIATGNIMEAGLGAIWREDPRYVRSPEAPFGKRVGHMPDISPFPAIIFCRIPGELTAKPL